MPDLNDVTPIVDAAAQGSIGGLCAVLYPLYQDSRIPPNERVDKDRLWYIMNLAVLPLGGCVFAILARTQCISIDPIMSAFVGAALPSLVQKWVSDTLSL